MSTNIISSPFLQLQVWLKITFLIFFFILEISSQHAKLGQSSAEFEEFPYVASIFWGSDIVDRACTGALLSLRHILIPDSCVSNESLEVIIYAGSVNSISLWEYTRQAYSGHINSEEVKHLRFPSGNLAILELPSKFIEGRAVTSIPIATEIQPNPNEHEYYIVGYPFSYPYGQDVINLEAFMMKTSINVNNRTYCGEHVPMYSELELCTGVITGGIGACDTLGAILIRKQSSPEGSDEIYGILHNDCCGVPRCLDTFYDLTNPAIREWIEEIIDTSGSEDPTSFEPTTEDPTSTTDFVPGECPSNIRRSPFVERECSFGTRIFTFLCKNLAQTLRPYFTNMDQKAYSPVQFLI